MTHYEDLTTCHYFGAWENCLVAIGWLEPDRPFATGEVSQAFLSRLVDLCKTAVQKRTVGCMMGLHRCGICSKIGVYTERSITVLGKKIEVGQRNVFVPAKDSRVFVAPSLIIHYVAEHSYCPPSDFQEAVLACPRMGSWAYYSEMRKRKADVWSWWKFLQSLHLPK